MDVRTIIMTIFFQCHIAINIFIITISRDCLCSQWNNWSLISVGIEEIQIRMEAGMEGKQKNFNKNSFLLNFLYSDAAHPSMETGHARSRNLPTLYSRTGHPESIRLCGTFPKCSPCCLLSFAVTCGFHEKPNFGSKNEKFLGAMEAKNYICCSSEAD